MEALVLFFWTVGLVNAASQSSIAQYYGAQYSHPAALEPRWTAVAPPAPVDRAEPRRDASAAKAFGEHWQNFMQPAVSRPAAPAAGFGAGSRW